MPEAPPPHIVIAGADPAGVFAALAAAPNSDIKVTLLAPAERILPEWRDDDHCANGLTREIWDPAEMAAKLVAGGKEMLGPFSRFGPGDFECWLEDHDLAIEANDNGVVHPANDSLDLAKYFLDQLNAREVNVQMSATLRAVDIKSTGGFWLTLTDERTIQADKLIIAGGGLIGNPLKRVIEGLDHHITECYPAMTGFQTKDARLRGAVGAVPGKCEVRISDTERVCAGKVELEPWGFSGPAVWSLSAQHTEQLNKHQYRFPLRISWLPGGSRAAAKLVEEQQRRNPRGLLGSFDDMRLPGKLWSNLIQAAGIPPETYWEELSTQQRSSLVRELAMGDYEIEKKKNVRGISVVQGGVCSEEIDFRTLGSRSVPGLYFAGNVLDVCASSPEINLQVDWTTGWIAGCQAAGIDH